MNEKKNGSKDTDTSETSDLECYIEYGLGAEDENAPCNPRYSIVIHSFRKRLADPDGISAKAAIDGLVSNGLLKDDSAKYVKEVTYKQEKSKQDKTYIEIWLEEEA